MRNYAGMRKMTRVPRKSSNTDIREFSITVISRKYDIRRFLPSICWRLVFPARTFPAQGAEKDLSRETGQVCGSR
jgi:hypothetical protein